MAFADTLQQLRKNKGLVSRRYSRTMQCIKTICFQMGNGPRLSRNGEAIDTL